MKDSIEKERENEKIILKVTLNGVLNVESRKVCSGAHYKNNVVM